MKVPILSKVKKLFIANKTVLIAVTMSLAIAVPATLFISGSADNKSAVLGDQKTAQTKDTEQETATDPTDTSKAEPNKPTTSTSPSKPTTSTPQSTTPAPDPTILSTCVWQGPQKVGEYCPYNPPSSWSYDFVKYPCRNITSSELVPCPSYREFTGINNQGFSNDDRGLCQFTISSKRIERNVIVTKSYGNGSPDCTTAIPQ